MQAVGLRRSFFINCGTVATVPSTQITNKLVLNLRVSAADRRKKAAGEHVVYHMPHSLGQHSWPHHSSRRSGLRLRMPRFRHQLVVLQRKLISRSRTIAGTELVAIRSANSMGLVSPCPSSTRHCEKPSDSHSSAL